MWFGIQVTCTATGTRSDLSSGSLSQTPFFPCNWEQHKNIQSTPQIIIGFTPFFPLFGELVKGFGCFRILPSFSNGVRMNEEQRRRREGWKGAGPDWLQHLHTHHQVHQELCLSWGIGLNLTRSCHWFCTSKSLVDRVG